MYFSGWVAKCQCSSIKAFAIITVVHAGTFCLSSRRRILTSPFYFFLNTIRYWPYSCIYKLTVDISL